MIGYVTIGAKDSAASGKFYDAVFQALGSERKIDHGTWLFYGKQGGGKGFGDCHTVIANPPSNGQEATSGNGTMIAYAAPSQDAVKAAYEAGLAAGGSDEGKPGPRGEDGKFFGAYLRDPTGNKICMFKMG